MSRDQTKEDLLAYLQDEQIAVVALKGLWGTGKTHLWNEIKGLWEARGGPQSLYASCFGVVDVDQLKLALFQNSLGATGSLLASAKDKAGQIVDLIGSVTAKLASKTAGDVVGMVGSLGGLLQSTVVDAVLKDRLVVLDDLERRAPALRTDAVMGFIDQLRRNGCRVLIIFNEEPIVQDKEMARDWRTLKEKCIDREIALTTTASEAASLGLSRDLPYRALIEQTLADFSITNIRVVQRIELVVRALFTGHEELSSSVAGPFVRTAAVLTALNFNAVPGGPDFGELVDQWLTWVLERKSSGGQQPSGPVAFASRGALSQDLAFLDLLHLHLVAGHRSKGQFTKLFAERQTDAAQEEANISFALYTDHASRNPKMSDEDFEALARERRSQWHRLDETQVDDISADLLERGFKSLGDEIVQDWIDRKIASNVVLMARQPFMAQVHHPELRKFLEGASAKGTAKPALLEAIKALGAQGFGQVHLNVVNEASIEEVDALLKGLDSHTFTIVMHFYLTQRDREQKGDRALSRGLSTFLASARQIVERAGEQTRQPLPRLLRKHLAHMLFPPSNPVQ